MSFLIDMWVKAQLPPGQPSLQEKSFPFFYQKGVTLRGSALAIALAPAVEHEFVPGDPLQQLQWPHMAQSGPSYPEDPTLHSLHYSLELGKAQPCQPPGTLLG